MFQVLTTSFVKWNKNKIPHMYNTMLTIILFTILFVNRILLNENYSPFINSGFFYLLFCKDVEQGLFRKHMSPILSPHSGMSSKVLDFGSGPGIMSVFFENYVGVDTDQTRVETATAAFPDKYFSKIDYITSQNQSIPFENGTFDVVLLNDCVHHINNKHMHYILQEIRRVLKPTGRIMLREPNRETSLFTWTITELFENGNYVRNIVEYKDLLNCDIEYEMQHDEYIRDYYVIIGKNCMPNPTISDTPIRATRHFINVLVYTILMCMLYNTCIVALLMK